MSNRNKARRASKSVAPKGSSKVWGVAVLNDKGRYELSYTSMGREASRVERRNLATQNASLAPRLVRVNASFKPVE